MKIEVLTQDDPIYTLPFFEEFLKHYSKELPLERIHCCRAMGKRSRKQMFSELMFLYKPIGFFRLCARFAAARVLGSLPKRSTAGKFRSFNQLCCAFGGLYEQIGSPNAPEFIEGVQRRAPDLIISVACPYILKQELLKIPRLGCINIHNAPLPRYKGMMPTFWQLFHGEKSVGCTIHYMAPKVDEGLALMQSKMDIEPGESLDQLIIRSKRHGAHLMAEVLMKLERGEATPARMDSAESSYFTFPTIPEMREFHRKGLRAI